jgi:hypothetical protein
MPARLRRPYRVKLGSDVSFPDLRIGPAILVGYSYTLWREISSQMRFFIDGSREPIGVTDNGRPTEWALPNLPLRPQNRRGLRDCVAGLPSRHARHAGGVSRHHAVWRRRCQLTWSPIPI